MLQQTQAARVVPKYSEFIKIFPNFNALASAKTSDVLKLWSGLGYNRRALGLKRAAEIIVTDYGGRLPKDASSLMKLPGIGPYTAGAILAFAFNEPGVFLETNIRRVFIHHFFKDKSGITDKQLMLLIEKTLPASLKGKPINPKSDGCQILDFERTPKNIQKSSRTLFDGLQKVSSRKLYREWYWALMDYGSYVVTITENPNRRSRHYNKQSKFEGSERQLRGNIIKLLLENKFMTLRQLQKSSNDSRTPEVVEKLAKEGFIGKKGAGFVIL